MNKIPVLFTADNSLYKNDPRFDCWDAQRNALTWQGQEPAIYHPPCRLFSRMKAHTKAGKCEKFLAYWAVMSVRKFGGIVEHPKGSDLWKEMGCNLNGVVDEWGGYLVSVNLSWFGFPAKKETVLYIVGCPGLKLPAYPLNFNAVTHYIRFGKRKSDNKKKEVSKEKRSETPAAMIEWFAQIIEQIKIQKRNMSILNNYPGAKSNSGLIQFLINNIPAHQRYFELFAGSAQLFRAKRPATSSFLNDINEDVAIALYRELGPISSAFSFSQFIESYFYDRNSRNIHSRGFTREDFMYLDPPYPASSRRNGRAYYRHEMLTDKEHLEFLTLCKTIDANIMISTKENDLYDKELTSWRKKTFDTVDRQGPYKEVIYMNYAEPVRLHQYDYLGEDYTDRQRIKRKIDRTVKKIKSLPLHERTAILQALTDLSQE